MDDANLDHLNVEIPDEFYNYLVDILSESIFENWMQRRRKLSPVSSVKGDNNVSQN